MSRKLFLAVLSIASAGLVAGTGEESCETLNVIKAKTHLLDPHQFVEKLETCKDMPQDNATIGTIVLLEVYKAINRTQKCILTSELETQLVQCVTSNTGIEPDQFTAATAKKRFGLDSTEAIVFNGQSCMISEKLLHCIEEKFSEKKLSHDLKGCKDNILRGFNVTSGYCQQFLLRPDRNSGFTYLPSETLILATVAMLAKLAVFSQF